MFRKYFAINLILLIIVGLLSFWFIKVWGKPLQFPAHELEHRVQKEKIKPADRKTPHINKSAYNVIVEKDLFRPSRSASKDKETIQSTSSRETPVLYGTIILGGEKSAIIEDPSTKLTKLYQINDSVSGFTVSDIQEDKVILLKDRESIEVRLRDVKTIRSRARKTPVRPSGRTSRTIRRRKPAEPPKQRSYDSRMGATSRQEKSLPAYYE